MQQLLNEVKDYLDITWQTSETEDKKLISMINRGAAALRGKIGYCDFVSDTPEKTLLLNYVMYERSASLHEFWTNYGPEITSLQMARWTEEGLANEMEN